MTADNQKSRFSPGINLGGYYEENTSARLLALAMCMALVACGGSPDQPNNSDPGNTNSADNTESNVIKIGVFEPASGDSASGGKKEMLGMQYANTETPYCGHSTARPIMVELVPRRQRLCQLPRRPPPLPSWSVRGCGPGSGAPMVPASPSPPSPIFDEAGLAAIGVTCTNPQRHRRQRPLLPDLLPGSLPGHGCAGQLSPRRSSRLEAGLPAWASSGNEYDQGLIAFFEQDLHRRRRHGHQGHLPHQQL